MTATREETPIENQVAIVHTSSGTLHVSFYPTDAPNHVRNFLYLAQKGFYEGVPFHRVVEHFVIQAGEARRDWKEPLPKLKAEFNSRKHQLGTMSAARTSDPNSANSQFYFVIDRSHAAHLDGLYTVFGQAFRGLETIRAIEKNAVGKPTKEDTITRVEVVEAAPFAAEIAAFEKTLK